MTNGELKSLKLSEIRTDGGTQSRTQMNFIVVQDYVEILESGESLPPIGVVYDGRDYWLWDGFHRTEAHERSGRTEVDAIVTNGTLRDAILLSVSANSDHGLRRTNDDKRKAVLTLLNDDEWSQWSDREIAKRCGVSNTLVSNIRSSLTVNIDSERIERTYTTKHGTPAMMSISNIGQTAQSRPVEKISLTPQRESWKPDVITSRQQSPLKTFFRYPGGKSKMAGVLVDEIIRVSNGAREYREPFVGGGGVFLPVLAQQHFSRYWINDFDFGIYCIWLSVKHFAYELTKYVAEFTPTVDAFYKFRETLNSDCRHMQPAYVAFIKIALHQMSYSGLGTRAGGPIGGAEQKSKYDVGCRWNGHNIISNITSTYNAMRSADVLITCLDYRSMLDGSNMVVYLDPPYYEQGSNLYHCTFSEKDHTELADKLKDASYPWVMSYDKCDDVQGLYAWADMRETNEIHYSIAMKNGNAGKQSRFASEYLITGGAV